MIGRVASGFALLAVTLLAGCTESPYFLGAWDTRRARSWVYVFRDPRTGFWIESARVEEPRRLASVCADPG